MPTALKISSLCKVYPNDFYALKGVDLEVKVGDFFALLGSNGAGKTTIIGIICGLLKKTSGTIKVMGLDQDSNISAVKSLIGLMPQEFNFNLFEPIEEILINQAGYHGIGRDEAKKNAEMLLKKMELWDKRGDIAKTLSGGMKRRLMLARALIHQPKILILDEPTAGVDVEIRRSMWVFLQELNRQGMSIILTTHYLEEAESLCRNIAIVDNGKIIKQTNMRDLLAQIPRQILILESSKKLGKIPTGLEFSITKLDEYSLEASVSSGVNITQVLQILSENGIEIKYVKSAQNRLETLFLDLIEDK